MNNWDNNTKITVLLLVLGLVYVAVFKLPAFFQMRELDERSDKAMRKFDSINNELKRTMDSLPETNSRSYTIDTILNADSAAER